MDSYIILSCLTPTKGITVLTQDGKYFPTRQCKYRVIQKIGITSDSETQVEHPKPTMKTAVNHGTVYDW